MMADHIKTVCRTGCYQLHQLHLITDANTCSDACPGLHRLSARLLQLVALWNCQQPTNMTTVRPECGSTSNHWYTAYKAHHTSSAITSLATSPAMDFVQAGGTGLQVSQWACTCLPGWRLWFVWSATTGLVLDRRHQRPSWRSGRPEHRLATDL